jgi:hypothetical protein
MIQTMIPCANLDFVVVVLTALIWLADEFTKVIEAVPIAVPLSPKAEPTPPPGGVDKPNAWPALSLDRIVRDKWEYDGLQSLGWYTLYALLSIAMIRSHWDGKAAHGRSHVLATFQAYGDPDFNQSLLAQKETMYDAADHMLRYLHYYAGSSTDRGLPDEAVYLTEYVQVKFARVIANVGKNCRYMRHETRGIAWR